MEFYKFLCVQSGVLLVMVFVTNGFAPTLDVYRDCATVINRMIFDNPCQDLEESTHCIIELSNSINQSCADVLVLPPRPYHNVTCDIFDGLKYHTPMVNKSRTDLDICSGVSALSKCRNFACYQGGVPFENDYRGAYPLSAGGCSVRGQKECVNPGINTKLSTQTCDDYMKAKYCFIDKLMACSGSNLNQIAADLMLIGLDEQLKECKRKGMMSGSYCHSNPLEGNEKPTREINMDNCNKVHKMGIELHKFSTKCKDVSSLYLMNVVSQGIVDYNAVGVECYLEYGCGCGINGQNLKMPSITLSAILGVFVYLIV